ncbi:MAG: HNH endonuclease [Gammaproteobacteria bacterium]
MLTTRPTGYRHRLERETVNHSTCIVTSELKSACRAKAKNANKPRRRQDDNGEWITVQPLPMLVWTDVLAVYLAYCGRCKWCGRFVGLPGTLEHVKRVADGGTNSAGNLAWSCKRCNSKGYWRN